MRLSFMKRAVLCLLAAIQVPAQVAVMSVPRIDLIEFYGLRRVTPQLARQALGLSPGDPLPPSKGDAEARLLDIDLVITARLEAVCCDGGKTVLYVGLQERDAPGYEVRPAPGGASSLPEPVLAAYRQWEAARPREQAEEYLLEPQSGRALPPLAASLAPHLAAVREVLRESSDEYQRAIAADLLPYVANKAEIIDDLRFALTDSDAAVRARAIRGLTALALLEQSNPASGIRVSPLWFLPLLQSVVWSDRTQAALALERLARGDDATLLAALRGDALASLIEMARWQTEQHAYPAFILVGRVAGLTGLTIRDAWLRAGRETVIAQALEKTR